MQRVGRSGVPGSRPGRGWRQPTTFGCSSLSMMSTCTTASTKVIHRPFYCLFFWVLLQCCRSGSLFDPWVQDLGSLIPNPYFWKLSDNFWIKSKYASLGSNIFLHLFKNKIILYCVLFATAKRVGQTEFFPHLFCCCCWIPDKHPGSATLFYQVFRSQNWKFWSHSEVWTTWKQLTVSTSCMSFTDFVEVFTCEVP